MSPARPARPVTAGAHRPTRWVRTRLRTGPWAALLTAGLAFVLVFLAVAIPRVLDRGADAALRDFLHDRGPLETSLLSTARSPEGGGTEAELEAVAAQLVARAGAGLPVAPSGPVFGAEALLRHALTTPGLDRPDGHSPPTLHLRYLHGFTEHTTLVMRRLAVRREQGRADPDRGGPRRGGDDRDPARCGPRRRLGAPAAGAGDRPLHRHRPGRAVLGRPAVHGPGLSGTLAQRPRHQELAHRRGDRGRRPGRPRALGAQHA